MNKFTFTCEQEDGVNTLEFETLTWVKAQDRFIDFLRGCGYFIDENEVRISEERASSCILMNLGTYKEND